MLLKEFLASKGNNKYFTTKPQIANLTYKNCQPRHWLFFESICCIQMKTRARVERGNVEGPSFKNQFRPKFTIAKRRNSSSNLLTNTSMPLNSGLQRKATSSKRDTYVVTFSDSTTTRSIFSSQSCFF